MLYLTHSKQNLYFKTLQPNPLDTKDLKTYFDKLVDKYNQPDFIPNDPIKIPHQFTHLQDIEIMGFWTAILAWGQRVTIINKSLELIELMEGRPHHFILHHSKKDRARFANFKHRTFNYTDTLYFLDFLQRYYRANESLEYAFAKFIKPQHEHVGSGLAGFHELFFDSEHAPHRTRKHVASPIRKSRCKRLNMFLRWMVRKDKQGVDFGIWKCIRPDQLLMPLDVHVERVARRFNLIERKQNDFQTVVELTKTLKIFDPKDPVKYDFALFSIGVIEKNIPIKTDK